MNPRRFCDSHFDNKKSSKRKRNKGSQKVWISKDNNGDYKVWGNPEAALNYLNTENDYDNTDLLLDEVCSDMEVIMGLDEMENNTILEVTYAIKSLKLKECPCGHGHLLK